MYPEPVHFQDAEGAWREIDNTLSLDESALSATGEAAYTPEASGLDIRIPQGFDGTQKLTLAKGDHLVALGVSEQNADAQLEKRARVVEVEDLASERVKTDKEALQSELQEELQVKQRAKEQELAQAEAQAKAQIELEAPVELQNKNELREEDLVDPLASALAEDENDELLIADEEETSQSEFQTDSQELESTGFIAENVLDSEIKQPKEREERKAPVTVQEKNQRIMEAKNKTSAVVYPDIFPGADLEYIVTATSIKENIILKEQQESYTYQFDLAMNGLIPVPQEDGSIFLMTNNTEGPQLPVFVLQAPYMYDAAGEQSNAVAMTLGEDGRLELTADAEWINDEAREWPVVVDPTIKTDYSAALSDNRRGLTRIEDKNEDGQDITWVNSRITKITDPAPRTVNLGYINNRLASITDAALRSTTFVYDNNGRLVTIAYPDNKSTSFVYDGGSNRLQKIIAFDGSSVTFGYDGKQRVVYMSRYAKNAAQPHEKLDFTYKQGGVTLVENNEDGRSMEYIFDNLGQAVNARNEEDQISLALYDKNAVIMTSTTQSVNTNLLRNSGFEHDDYWGYSPGAAGYSNENSSSGNRSMRMSSNASSCWNHVAQGFVGAQPGKTYTISADILIPEPLYGDGGVVLGFAM